MASPRGGLRFAGSIPIAMHACQPANNEIKAALAQLDPLPTPVADWLVETGTDSADATCSPSPRAFPAPIGQRLRIPPTWTPPLEVRRARIRCRAGVVPFPSADEQAPQRCQVHSRARDISVVRQIVDLVGARSGDPGIAPGPAHQHELPCPSSAFGDVARTSLRNRVQLVPRGRCQCAGRLELRAGGRALPIHHARRVAVPLLRRRDLRCSRSSCSCLARPRR